MDAAQTLKFRRRHYEIERQLADRLRKSTGAERLRLYGEVYDELFQRVPDHIQLARARDEASRNEAVEEKLRLLSRFLRPDTVFLEIGAGDCSLTEAVSKRVRISYALDVSAEILQFHQKAPNIRAVLSDGCSTPVPDGTVTLAYSNQVMEHIHPDDARGQLANIYRALAPGGTYLCITPSRLNGPHDVSMYFDNVATCFHLKEYTFRDLRDTFRSAGFRSVTPYIGMAGRYVAVPPMALSVFENCIESLPRVIRRDVMTRRPLCNLLFLSVIARK
jgi:SAM-dependent methyltransferase